MKKYIFLALLLAISSLLFKVNNVFAVTCTQSGGTAYCTDTKTGRTTTYNQYGNNIYGSDGSSYTMYGNTTYGSGNVFNIGGNSGSSLPPLSTAGADMDSPEMKEAEAKRQKACATSNFSTPAGEPIIGGTQASNCRDATTEWLKAVSDSQKKNANAPTTPSTNYNSDSSSAKNESLDDYMTRVLSILDKNNNQPENLCVSRGIPNSHQDGNYCKCDNGYFHDDNASKCRALSVENCKESYGDGAIPNYATNFCKCDTGYTVDTKGNICVANSKKVIKNPQKNNSTMASNNLSSNKTQKIEKEITPIEQKEEVGPRRMTKAEYDAEYGNPEPVKKAPWYKRMLNWFKGN